MRKTKASLWVLAATAITVATLFLLPYTPRVAVRTATVRCGDLLKTLLLEGAVVPGSQQVCVSLLAGRVSEVYVTRGQVVKNGDLLFRMDTTAEERALAEVSRALRQRESMLGTLPASDALAVVAAQGGLELSAREEELRAAIQLKQVRAQTDGVMGGVYVRQGDYVPEAALLGQLDGEGVRVNALCRPADVSGVQTGAPATLLDASGDTVGLATLASVGAPQRDEATVQYLQALVLSPVGDQAPQGVRVGDSVTVELLTEALYDRPLAPVAAVGSGDLLWLVKDGKAVAAPVDVEARNDAYVCVPQELLGCTVILNPDELALYTGCPVKEAKRR